MNPEILKYEQITRFLRDELQDNEVDAFNEKLNAENQFSEEVDVHRNVHDILMDGGLLNVKDRLQSIHQKNVRLKTNRNFITGASAIVLVIIVAILSYLNTADESVVDNQIITPPLEIIEKSPIVEDPYESNSNLGSIMDTVAHVVSRNEIEKKDLFVKEKSKEEELGNEDVDEVLIQDTKVQEKEIETEKPNVKIEESSIETVSQENIEEEYNPCEGIELFVETTTKSPCNNKSNGEIVIDELSLSGGLAPYTFTIGNITTERFIFKNLKKGTYEVVVEDANRCNTTIIVDLLSKDCEKENEYIIRPLRNERWELPVEDVSGECKLIIYNQVGMIVFTTQEGQSLPETWDGSDNDGSSLPMGTYLYLIQCADNNDTNKGYITIVK